DIDKGDPGIIWGDKPVVGRCRLQCSSASAVNSAPWRCYLKDLGSRLAQSFEGWHDPGRRHCEIAIVDVQHHVAVDAILAVQAAVAEQCRDSLGFCTGQLELVLVVRAAERSGNCLGANDEYQPAGDDPPTVSDSELSEVVH